MKTKKEIAVETHNDGFNCAQSVIAPFCEKYGANLEISLKMAGGMGGGFRSGGICGAASGGVLVIGLKYGQKTPGDLETKKICGAKTQEFLKAFKAKNMFLDCRDLLKFDISTEEGARLAKERNVHNTICKDLIENAVELLEKLGY